MPELIQRARNAVGEERAWLCTLVNRALSALPAASDKDKQAPVLLQMLDDEALHDMEDDKKVPCRAVAVEALLSIGYPWALQLDPDDVQFLREHPAFAKSKLPVAQVFSAFAGVTAVTFIGLSLVQTPMWWVYQLLRSPTDLALAATLVTTMLCAIPLALGRKYVKPARWLMGLASLTFVGLLAGDALTSGMSSWHLVMATVPALGLLSTGIPREPGAQKERPDPTLPTTPSKL